MGTLKCRRCGAEQDSSIKCCRTCGVFMEGPAVNNVTGETGYRGADGVFYRSFWDYSRRDGRLDGSLPAGLDMNSLGGGETEGFPATQDLGDQGRSARVINTEKDGDGFPLRQVCLFRDPLKDDKVRVSLRRRRDRDAPWGEWNLVGTLDMASI